MTLQSPPHTLKWHQWLVIALVFFSMAMSAIISQTVFEGLPHLEDEVAYLFQAKIFAGGHLVIDTPQPRRAYWQPFVVDYTATDKRFGKYTPGWPGLLAVGVVVGQPWIINTLLSGLTVALVYRLGREIFYPEVGTAAAALTAFSPMALLLDGTLMGHTAALCFAMIFLYGYWRMSRGKSHALRWGMVAGTGLGMVVVMRPLTAVGIATPFVVWSVVRLIHSFIHTGGSETRPYMMILRPLVVLGTVTLIIASAIPIFNTAATGDPTLNLYTLVWEYDQIGFGDCCGRHGHTLEKGLRQMRWDFALTAADLFGWQIGPLDEAARDHLLNGANYYPNLGVSWILLPFGLLLGFRRRWAWVWLIVGVGWLLLLDSVLSADPDAREALGALWVGFGGAWMLSALAIVTVFKHPRSAVWTWLLLAVPLCLIGVHLAYWIGSQRYSTRYYFEGLAAVALVSAIPIGWLMRRYGRLAVGMILAVLLLGALVTYSLPRIAVLKGFNFVGQDKIEVVEARRVDDHPILVIVTGPAAGDNAVLWRSRGSLMAVTSPYLDSDIVVAWDYAPENDALRQSILERFPNRQVIDMGARGNEAWFIDGD